jgi:hypothetical protein
MKKIPFIINGKGEVVVIKTRGMLKKIMDEKLYKVEWGFLQLRKVNYRVI